MNIFDSGSKWERFQEIRPGDTFHAYNRYLGCKDRSKPDAAYRLFTQTSETILLNQRDEMVSRITGGVIVTCSKPGMEETAKKQKAKGHDKREPYPQEVLDKLYQNMTDQLMGKFRRGSNPRYWEDVNEGDQLDQIIFGPYDDSDGLSICSAMGFSVGMATKWGAIQSDMARAVTDELTGAYSFNMNWHCSDHIAQSLGVPFAVQYGLHSQAMLAYTLDQWAGDDAFIKKLDMQCRTMCFFGDISYNNGKVVKKYIEDGEHLVDLELESRRYDGTLHTPCHATVRLLSKEDE